MLRTTERRSCGFSARSSSSVLNGKIEGNGCSRIFSACLTPRSSSAWLDFYEIATMTPEMERFSCDSEESSLLLHNRKRRRRKKSSSDLEMHRDYLTHLQIVHRSLPDWRQNEKPRFSRSNLLQTSSFPEPKLPNPTTSRSLRSKETRRPRLDPPPSWQLLMFYFACVFCIGSHGVVVAFDCDIILVSNDNGPKNGTFSAPHPSGHVILPPQGVQCIYTFIALPTERVKISFRQDFNLLGRPPECLHEYIDLYTELRNASEDLVQTDKFGGRFCGKIPPRNRISLFNTLVLVFSSDRSNLTTGSHIFIGSYEFINASAYDMGTPAPPTHNSCTYLVKSWVKRLGDIYSPTYPGVYPQRIMCSYQFLGERGQRNRVEFMDFDLFSGGLHCPYDRLTIYDGATEQDPIIGNYCGPIRNLVVFSSQENLFISFITNRSGGENRGFHAIFEFSEMYVNLEFITGEHIRGTECDQRILSTGRNWGEIQSPNAPFPYLPNVKCWYVIEGLNNAEDLETVKLYVQQFDMPPMLGAYKGDCSTGGLSVWTKGREEPAKQAHLNYCLDDPGRPADATYCGTNEIPKVITSKDSKLVLKFCSGSTQGLGFKIRYEFETNFAVPGTMHPISTMCEVRYRSSVAKAGEFHSPRHPSNYPSNNNCTYIFEGESHEQTHVEFDLFALSGNGTTARTCDHQDYIDIYELRPTPRGDEEERPVGRYCGKATPAPIKTRFGWRGLKMRFHTDATGVTNGFRGRYRFAPEKTSYSSDGSCGMEITNATHGVIRSPNYNSDRTNKYPAGVDCEWLITAHAGHKILLNFTYFALEGDQATSGCPGAALKIYTYTPPDLHPIELCGDRSADAISVLDYTSHGNVLKLIFTTAAKATGGFGFELVWNEGQHRLPGRQCESGQMFCTQTEYCISEELKCDDQYNCGKNDNTDELNCTPPSSLISGALLGTVVGGVGAGLILIGIIVVCVVRRKNVSRRRKAQQQQQQQNQHDWNS